MNMNKNKNSSLGRNVGNADIESLENALFVWGKDRNKNMDNNNNKEGDRNVGGEEIEENENDNFATFALAIARAVEFVDKYKGMTPQQKHDAVINMILKIADHKNLDQNHVLRDPVFVGGIINIVILTSKKHFAINIKNFKETCKGIFNACFGRMM